MKHILITDIGNVVEFFEFAFCAGAIAAGCINPHDELPDQMTASIKENAQKMEILNEAIRTRYKCDITIKLSDLRK